jgi:hypothetical protein
MFRAHSSRSRRTLAVALAVLSAGFLEACGPTQSTAFLIDAETMMEAARTAQAEKLAPYDWTLARLYLLKSKEEVGYSEFEQAVDYAKKAVEFATRARDNAVKAVRKSEAPPPPPPPPSAEP